MSLLDALNWRYAVKQFNTQRISQTHLETLIESVRLAPSAYGIQPYKLIVVEDTALREQCIAASYGQEKVAHSSHLIVMARQNAFSKKHTQAFIEDLAKTQQVSPNELNGYQQQIESDLLARTPEAQAQWMSEQSYLALGVLLSTAASLKIDACPMTGFDSSAINSILGLNEQGLHATWLCPVGYRCENDSAAKRPKHRIDTQQLLVSL